MGVRVGGIQTLDASTHLICRLGLYLFLKPPAHPSKDIPPHSLAGVTSLLSAPLFCHTVVFAKYC